MSDRIAALRKRAETEAVEIWRPEPGDALAGEIVGFRTAHTTSLGEQKLLMLRADDGAARAIWVDHWLRFAMRAHDAKEGDLIALTFLGWFAMDRGHDCGAYSIIVEHAPE
jgi:hypothetical protein